jgi:hypothetical protein
MSRSSVAWMLAGFFLGCTMALGALSPAVRVYAQGHSASEVGSSSAGYAWSAPLYSYSENGNRFRSYYALAANGKVYIMELTNDPDIVGPPRNEVPNWATVVKTYQLP